MTVVAGLLAAAALLAASGRRSGERVRWWPPAPARRPSGSAVSASASRRAAAALAGLALAWIIGGLVGWALAAATGIGVDRVLARLEPRAVRVRRARIRADLPVAADLFAACLLSGCSPPEAAEAVAGALGGPVGERLRRVAGTIRLGGEPARSFAALAAEPELARFGHAVAGAIESGSALATTMLAEADEQRRVARAEADAAARRASVWVAAPLGLCFLPAFVLIGVVPVVAGIAGQVLR